jgi:hypothetical protein
MAADVGSTLASWSTTESSNSPAGATSISQNLDDNIRMIQAVVRTLAAASTIASATTTDLSTVNEKFITVTGTTTITGLGILSPGIEKVLVFAGALTFTHNVTSLILPGAANITTAAGDIAHMLSLGSGNWRCLSYQPASGYQAKSEKDATGGYAGLTLFKINFKNAANTFTSFFTNANTAARTYTFQDRDGTIADDTDLATKQSTSGKDASGGYAGLTLFKINFKNVANTFTSFFTNSNTAARTYTFQDRDGTIVDNTDLALKAPIASPTFTGTLTSPPLIVSGTGLPTGSSSTVIQNSGTGESRLWALGPDASTNGTLILLSARSDGTNSNGSIKLDTSGNFLGISNVSVLGYGTGSGGTVGQLTSKSTGVTLSTPTGQITMNNAALSANTSVSFTWTNTLITAKDVVLWSQLAGTDGAYTLTFKPAAGSCTVTLRNVTAGSLSEAFAFQFNIYRGAST